MGRGNVTVYQRRDGGGYAGEHDEWNGRTISDLLFFAVLAAKKTSRRFAEKLLECNSRNDSYQGIGFSHAALTLPTRGAYVAQLRGS